MSQPLNSITQIAYVVDELEPAARRWHALTGAGPFFLLEHLQLVEARYRGRPTGVDVSIALGYSGGLCVEFIVQHNDAPSVFRELQECSGGGFHHWAIMTEAFDEDVKRYRDRQLEIAFSGAVAVGGRFVYVDTHAQLGGMVELIEVTPPVRQLFETIEAASVDWDGRDPIRRL